MRMYPPIEFELYGLNEEWAGKRWLAMIEGSGEEVYGLVLVHGDTHRPIQGQSSASVATWPTAALAKFDRQGRPRHAAAERVAMSVLDVTQPTLPRRAESAYRRNMFERFMAEAERYVSWPSRNWTVDGRPTRAHTFSWAGVWGGFTVIGDVAVIVTATDLDMDKLQLMTLADTRAYHFDSREGLTFPESLLRSQESAGLAAHEEWVPWPRHPDHDELLRAD